MQRPLDAGQTSFRAGRTDRKGQRVATAGWTLDGARDVLLLAGYEIAEVRPIPHGQQIRCVGGQLLSVYAKGSFLAQGRDAAALKALFASGPGQGRAEAAGPGVVSATRPSVGPMDRSGQDAPGQDAPGQGAPGQGVPGQGAAVGMPLFETAPSAAPLVGTQAAGTTGSRTDPAGRAAVARRVTDYPSTRPEDAGLAPPW